MCLCSYYRHTLWVCCTGHSSRLSDGRTGSLGIDRVTFQTETKYNVHRIRGARREEEIIQCDDTIVIWVTWGGEQSSLATDSDAWFHPLICSCRAFGTILYQAFSSSVLVSWTELWFQQQGQAGTNERECQIGGWIQSGNVQRRRVQLIQKGKQFFRSAWTSLSLFFYYLPFFIAPTHSPTHQQTLDMSWKVRRYGYEMG